MIAESYTTYVVELLKSSCGPLLRSVAVKGGLRFINKIHYTIRLSSRIRRNLGRIGLSGDRRLCLSRTGRLAFCFLFEVSCKIDLDFLFSNWNTNAVLRTDLAVEFDCGHAGQFIVRVGIELTRHEKVNAASVLLNAPLKYRIVFDNRRWLVR